jgi:hypothetical protein
MKENKSYRLWKVIFTGGTVLVFILSFIVVLYIPFSYQWINSLLCAAACFLMVWFQARRPERSPGGDRTSRALLLMGIAEIIFSVLSLRVVVQNLPVPMWMIGFVFLSPIAYTGAYRLFLPGIFPQAGKSLETPEPEPLAEFPQAVRGIMKDGQKRVNTPVAFTILAFTLLGAIMYLTSVFMTGKGVTLLFFVPAALGYLVGIPLGIFLTYRWQHQARQSGISEEQLKAAAKAAHLWWPKARETTNLQKPGRFTGS